MNNNKCNKCSSFETSSCVSCNSDYCYKCQECKCNLVDLGDILGVNDINDIVNILEKNSDMENVYRLLLISYKLFESEIAQKKLGSLVKDADNILFCYKNKNWYNLATIYEKHSKISISEKYFKYVVDYCDKATFAPIFEKDNKFSYACECYEKMGEKYYKKLIELYSGVNYNSPKLEYYLKEFSKSVNPEDIMDLAKIYYSLNRKEESNKCYERITSNQNFCEKYAVIFENENELELACKCYETLNHSKYYNKLVALYKLLRNFDKVEFYLQKKKQLGDDVKDEEIELAKLYESKNIKKSIEIYKRYCKVDHFCAIKYIELIDNN